MTLSQIHPYMFEPEFEAYNTTQADWRRLQIDFVGVVYLDQITIYRMMSNEQTLAHCESRQKYWKSSISEQNDVRALLSHYLKLWPHLIWTSSIVCVDSVTQVMVSLGPTGKRQRNFIDISPLAYEAKLKWMWDATCSRPLKRSPIAFYWSFLSTSQLLSVKKNIPHPL